MINLLCPRNPVRITISIHPRLNTAFALGTGATQELPLFWDIPNQTPPGHVGATKPVHVDVNGPRSQHCRRWAREGVTNLGAGTSELQETTSGTYCSLFFWPTLRRPPT